MATMYMIDDRIVKGIKSKKDASDILSQMIRIAHDYGVASVADLRDLLGFITDYKDTKRIWTEHAIRDAAVFSEPMYDTWVIRLPVPASLISSEKKITHHVVCESNPSPEPLNITIDTDSADENTLSEVFEHVRTIKDRPIFISIN